MVRNSLRNPPRGIQNSLRNSLPKLSQGSTQTSEEWTIWWKENVCNCFYFIFFILFWIYFLKMKYRTCLYKFLILNYLFWKYCVKVCHVCYKKSRNTSKHKQYIFSSTSHAKGKNAHVTTGSVYPARYFKWMILRLEFSTVRFFVSVFGSVRFSVRFADLRTDQNEPNRKLKM